MVLPPAPFGSISTLDLTFWIVSLKSFSIASSVSLLLADSAAAMLDVIRLPPAITLPSCSTMRAAAVASSMTGSTAVSMALSRLWASNISGIEAATKSACALRSASYFLSCAAAASSRSRAAEARLLVMSSMFFTVSVSAVTMVLSAPSAMTSLSLASAVACVSLIFLRRSFSASSVRTASTAGPWLARAALCAESCRLAASRGMSVPERSTITPPRWRSTRPAPAEITMAMPAMMAKAENKLPRTPNFGRRILRNPSLPIEIPNAIAPSPIRYLKVNRGGSIAVPG